MPSHSTVTTDWELSSVDAEEEYNEQEKLRQNRLRWALRRQRNQQQNQFNGEHDSDTGMESMSSTDHQHIVANVQSGRAHKNNIFTVINDNNTKVVLRPPYSNTSKIQKFERINVVGSDGETNETVTSAEHSPILAQQSASTRCSLLSSHHTGSCSFCSVNENDDRVVDAAINNTSSLLHHDSDDCKRLGELVIDVERLIGEKGDLLQQNVTCKTDIKKLKERFIFCFLKVII